MLYKVKNISEFIKDGYKILPINLDIGFCNESSEVFIKPMSIWFQLKHYNKGSRLDDKSKYFFGKALYEEWAILLQNCKIIANNKTKIIIIKPSSILYQLYYLATFGYLRQQKILTEDYTIAHRVIDFLHSKNIRKNG